MIMSCLVFGAQTLQGDFCDREASAPEQQRDKSLHGVQTLVMTEVVTLLRLLADEMMKLMKLMNLRT